MKKLPATSLKILGVTSIVFAGMLGSQAQAANHVASSTRAQQMVFYFTPQFIGSQGSTYDDGSSSSTDTRYGFGFAFGYNLNDHIELGAEFLSTWADYTLTSSPANGSERYNGSLYTSSFNANVTYNILKAPLTPYITGSIGTTFIDSGIDDPSGATLPGCGYDPFGWWDCTDIPATVTRRDMNYGASAGLRYDYNRNVFVKGGIGKNYIGSSGGTADFVTYQFYLGYMF